MSLMLSSHSQHHLQSIEDMRGEERAEHNRESRKMGYHVFAKLQRLARRARAGRMLHAVTRARLHHAHASALLRSARASWRAFSHGVDIQARALGTFSSEKFEMNN
eukprot:6197514-Pleurochrysis_carterae.AAC.4